MRFFKVNESRDFLNIDRKGSTRFIPEIEEYKKDSSFIISIPVLIIVCLLFYSGYRFLIS